MAYTDNIGVELLSPGTQQAHSVVNDALDVFDRAIAGITSIDLSASSSVALQPWQSTQAILKATGATQASTVTVQNKPKSWIFINTTGFGIAVGIADQVAAPVVPAGATKLLLCDGVTGVILVV